MSRPSDPRKLAVWRKRFERFSRSGLAVRRFCAREGISTVSFYHWRKKLGFKGRGHSAGERPPRGRTTPGDGHRRFRQVAVVPGASRILPTAPVITIQLPGGTRLEVGADDLDLLRTVVAEVVRGECGVEVGRADRGREAEVGSC